MIGDGLQEVGSDRPPHPSPSSIWILAANRSRLRGELTSIRTTMCRADPIRRRITRVWNAPVDGDVELEKSNILMAGPTGCGKTTTAINLAVALAHRGHHRHVGHQVAADVAFSAKNGGQGRGGGAHVHSPSVGWCSAGSLWASSLGLTCSTMRKI